LEGTKQEFIQVNLTDDVIDTAFAQLLPITIIEDTYKIKEILKQRKETW
jgi:hypothetical protein